MHNEVWVYTEILSLSLELPYTGARASSPLSQIFTIAPIVQVVLVMSVVFPYDEQVTQLIMSSI